MVVCWELSKQNEQWQFVPFNDLSDLYVFHGYKKGGLIKLKTGLVMFRTLKLYRPDKDSFGDMSCKRF